MVARLRSIATMIFRRSRWEEELKEELQFHLEARADALVRAGLSPEEAMRRARVEFGRLDRSKEGCREARGGRWIDELSRNLVVAGRSIRKNPGFSLVAVLSLALGIGGNLAVFGIVQRLLLTELPVREPDQLYELVVVSSRGVTRGISYQKFERVRDHFTFFPPVFGWGGLGRYPLTDGTLPSALWFTRSVRTTSKDWASVPHSAGCSFPRMNIRIKSPSSPMTSGARCSPATPE